jgi:signal transduction histidine kinase
VDVVAVANRDIHARKTAEAELAQAVMFRERVMGMLGHDLRNPLSAILGLAGLLQLQEGIPDRVRDGLQRMQQSAQRMNEMISTILDVTRLRYGGAALSLESVDLGTLANAIVDELRVVHAGRRIDARAHGDLHGRWDPGRMGQVISNLVGNALTHGDEDAAVEVRLSSEDGAVSVAVSNRGPTIPAEQVPQLFEPFRQGDHPRKSGGLGLGLFIVRSLVIAHGGEIDVVSRDGVTTFTVRFPRETAAKTDG